MEKNETIISLTTRDYKSYTVKIFLAGMMSGFGLGLVLLSYVIW